MRLMTLSRRLPLWFIVFLKRNFRKGGDILADVVANPQVCPTFSEISFEK
jgi:hypothetical protein